jgi:hypothetical protein
MAREESEALTKLIALREIRKKQAGLDQHRQRLLKGLDFIQSEDQCLAEYKVLSLH